jgi:hypothetical protein
MACGGSTILTRFRSALAETLGGRIERKKMSAARCAERL